MLVDSSIVTVEERSGGLRYRVLGSLRQSGAEKLRDASDSARLTLRHRDWYHALVRAAEADSHGPSQLERLNQVEIELDNIREAFNVSLTQPGDDEAALEIAAGPVDFWILHGHHLSEGRRWLETALASARV